MCSVSSQEKAGYRAEDHTYLILCMASFHVLNQWGWVPLINPGWLGAVGFMQWRLQLYHSTDSSAFESVSTEAIHASVLMWVFKLCYRLSHTKCTSNLHFGTNNIGLCCWMHCREPHFFLPPNPWCLYATESFRTCANVKLCISKSV